MMNIWLLVISYISIPKFVTITINPCKLGEGIISYDGVTFLGSDNILIDYNYWMNGYDINNQNFVDMVHINNNHTMFYSICPVQFV